MEGDDYGDDGLAPLWPPLGPPSPSVMLSLASDAAVVEGQVLAKLTECCRELEEGQRVWAVHRREAAWRLKRVEQ